MYERPEDISMRITSIAAPMGAAAVAIRMGGGTPPDVARILTECGSAVDDQFGLIHEQVDQHSDSDHTELLRIKVILLRQAVQTTTQLIPQLISPGDDDTALIRAVTDLLAQCVEGVCEQYAHCQAGYQARSNARRGRGRGIGRL